MHRSAGVLACRIASVPLAPRPLQPLHPPHILFDVALPLQPAGHHAAHFPVNLPLPPRAIMEPKDPANIGKRRRIPAAQLLHEASVGPKGRGAARRFSEREECIGTHYLAGCRRGCRCRACCGAGDSGAAVVGRQTGASSWIARRHLSAGRRRCDRRRAAARHHAVDAVTAERHAQPAALQFVPRLYPLSKKRS